MTSFTTPPSSTHSEVRTVGRCRDEDATSPGLKVSCGFLLRGKETGAFQRNLDAKLAVRQLGRIADGGDADLAALNHQRVAIHGDFSRKAAVDRVEPQEMGIGLGRAKVVDGDDVDVLAAALDDGAKNVASDPPKSIDRHPHSHSFLLDANRQVPDV